MGDCIIESLIRRNVIWKVFFRAIQVYLVFNQNNVLNSLENPSFLMENCKLLLQNLCFFLEHTYSAHLEI